MVFPIPRALSFERRFEASRNFFQRTEWQEIAALPRRLVLRQGAFREGLLHAEEEVGDAHGVILSFLWNDEQFLAHASTSANRGDSGQGDQ